MGRPLKGESKRDKRITIRVTNDEFDRIEEVTKKAGLSKTETIVKAVEFLGDLLKQSSLR